MTKTAKHSLFFKIWVHVRGLLAFVIVLLGIIVGLVSLVLPNGELYKQHLSGFLSKQWNKPVEISEISGSWKGFGPRFAIQGLKIKDKDEVTISQATLNVNLLEYLIPKGSTGINLSVNEIDVDFEQKDSGKIVLAGERKTHESLSEKLDKILSSGSLSIDNLSLNFKSKDLNQNYQLKSKITVQQSDLQRAFELQLNAKEVADEFKILSVAEKDYDFSRQANWYVESKNLSLQNLGNLVQRENLPKALVDVKSWFSTKHGNIVQLIAQAKLKDKFFASESEKYDITGDAELVYSGEPQNWQASLYLFGIETNNISQENIQIDIHRVQKQLIFKADALDIPLLNALLETLDFSNELPLNDFNIDGHLSDVSIVYDFKERRIMDGSLNFQNLDIKSPWASLSNISGEISLKDEQIRLLIDSDSGTAEIPGMIRGIADWDKLLLTAQTSMQDDDLDIKINSLWCDCKDFILDGAARANYDENLFLDLTFGVYQAQVNQLHKYWPANKWKPKVLDYLDTALIDGAVKEGMILYHGLVNEYPFRSKQGVFRTRSNLVDATIKYQKEWPVSRDLNALVETENRKLWVDVSKAKVMQANINKVHSQISNLKNPVLTTDIWASGKDNFLLDILQKSGMSKGIPALANQIDFKGRQNVKVDLSLPLNSPQAKAIPQGYIEFHETDFQMNQFQLHDMKGKIDYKGFSINLENLKATFLNQETFLNGSIINEPNQSPKIDILLKGNYSTVDFESLTGFVLPAQGQSNWDFEISNAESDDESDSKFAFTAKSNLEGTQLNIPAPFNKTSDEVAPFSVRCELPCLDSNWTMDFDNRLKTDFSLATDKSEFVLKSLNFGNQLQDSFGGKIDELNLDEWLELLVKDKGNHKEHKIPFQNMKLDIGSLIFMSRRLNHIEIEFSHDEDGLNFDIRGEEVEGLVVVPNDIENRGIIVQLERLHWHGIDDEIAAKKAEKVSVKYPALHVWIGDFIYDGIPLGESRIEVRPVVEGLRIEKFVTNSDLLKLNINGIWYKNKGDKGTSEFNIILTSENIAEFLVSLGFSAPISQANTIIDMKANWSGFPSQFEVRKISGNLHIEVGEGEVVDAKPGVGRILGLFSLTNLPRRLILDFKDVFGKGLQFKSMKGDFILNDGNAYSEEFIIDAASAKISIKGRTGLAQQDYDQIVIVTPGVGKILPTIGAITGGAVGAAAGFLFQGMFNKGLKNVGKIVYKVTGTWDQPNIEIIETEEIPDES